MPAKKKPTKREEELQQQNEELQIRLAEAEETLGAIREGEVDAVVVSGAQGEQIFSLVGADSIYRLIVETMKEAAFTVSLDGRILFCNAQFSAFVKTHQEQIIGRRLAEFVPLEQRRQVAGLLVKSQSEPVRQRLVFQGPGGAPAVPAHISAVMLHQGDSQSICVVANDLTELENSTELIQQLRRQQEALQAANEELAATEEELRVQNEELSASRVELDRTRTRYQDLFETAPDGYLVTDPEGTIQEANQAVAGLLGRPAAELKGNPFSAFVPAAEWEGYLRILSALHCGAPLPKWEVEIRPLAGPQFWAEVVAASSCDEEGRIVGLRWLIHDITERKRAEEALRQSSERFRIMGEILPYGVWWCNAQGGAEYASQSFLDLLEMSTAEMREFGWSKRLPANEVEPMMHRWLRCVQTGENWDDEHNILGPDGKYHAVLTRGRPVRGLDGQIIGWAGINLDIGDLKQAEETLRHTAAELERSNRDLEAFAYLASHDLQAPLRQVRGFVKMLSDRYKGKLDEKADEYIDFAVNGAAQMSGLITDLLAYSKVGSKDLKFQSVNLREPLDRALSLLHSDIDGCGVKITIADLPTVQAHSGEFAQVFQNFIGNAIKFRSERPLEIEVVAKREGGQWHLCVKDNGIGLDPKVAQQAFEMFRRLHDCEKYPGTGIGLAICKKIIERHGGCIWVESELGQGSAFCFSLPAEGK